MTVSVLISILSIYLFVAVGYIAKKFLKDKIDNKTLTYISMYSLQPILTFWGLTLRPIDSSLVVAPLLYLLAVFVGLATTLFLAKVIYKEDSKKGVILSTISLIGNTGNLGIPLGIVIFGVESVPYTSIINIANLFFIYTIGAYFLAKSEYSLKEAIKSIVSIPVIWVAIFAIIFNLSAIQIPEPIVSALEMGGHASIVIQLMIFGIYISGVQFREFDIKLNTTVLFSKLILLPLIGFSILYQMDYLTMIGAIIIMELMMPIAVNNVNMASIYNIYPEKVASTILSSSAIFILIFYIYLEIYKV